MQINRKETQMKKTFFKKMTIWKARLGGLRAIYLIPINMYKREEMIVGQRPEYCDAVCGRLSMTLHNLRHQFSEES